MKPRRVYSFFLMIVGVLQLIVVTVGLVLVIPGSFNNPSLSFGDKLFDFIVLGYFPPILFNFALGGCAIEESFFQLRYDDNKLWLTWRSRLYAILHTIIASFAFCSILYLIFFSRFNTYEVDYAQMGYTYEVDYAQMGYLIGLFWSKWLIVSSVFFYKYYSWRCRRLYIYTSEVNPRAKAKAGDQSSQIIDQKERECNVSNKEKEECVFDVDLGTTADCENAKTKTAMNQQ